MPILNAKLKIIVMGTRGKSSLTGNLAKYFHANGFNVFSRQTGLISVAIYNGQSIYVHRDDGEIIFDRPAETKEIIEYFDDYSADVAIIEDNGISEHHSATLNEYINPDLVIITTISPDHIMQQGTNPKETFKIFMNSVTRKSKVVFWSNHAYEVNVAKELMGKSKKVEILQGFLEDRDDMILPYVAEIATVKGFGLRIPPKPLARNRLFQSKFILAESVAGLDNGKSLINLGSVNDLLHTHMLFNEALRDYSPPFYLLLNFRHDRDERIWQFLEYYKPFMNHYFRQVIIYSEHLAFSSHYVCRSIKKSYPEVSTRICQGFSDFEDNILPALPAKSTVLVVANTANRFGEELIDKYKFFRDSYPILKDVSIVAINESQKQT
jgi:hypothetical protein